jgi:membrane dipeptidase
MRMKNIITLFITVLLIASLSFCGKKESKVEDPIKLAAEIHDRVLTIDTHTDTPFRLMDPEYDMSQEHDARNRGGKVDFPRMKKGGLDAVFFAVFLGQGERTPEGHVRAKERALKIFDAIHKTMEKHPDIVQLALNADDAYKIEKTGKRAVYIGIENGYPVGHDISNIKEFYNLGARYITLVHTRDNDLCDSSTDGKDPEDRGLSDLGKNVVAEMNRLGMMVDVSHCSDKSFYDILETSKAPVIASHSSARAVCDNPRNLTDDMLKKLAENGGVCQVCILSDYIKKPAPNPEREAAFKVLREKFKNYDELSESDKKKAHDEWRETDNKFPRVLATVADAVDHIDHIVKVAGIDHVGIGTDFDGGGGIDGCYDASEMGNITIELVKRGYSEEDIRKIWGGNFIRVFKKVEALKEKR